MSKRSPRTARRHLAPLTDDKNEVYRRVLDAIAWQRRNPDMSLSETARRSGTTLSAVRRHAASAVTYKEGRWQAKAYDNLPRRMLFLTDRGYASVLTTDSHDASLIAEYHNAIREFLFMRDTSLLKDFEGDYIESEGRRYYFLTDPKTINRLVRAGAIHVLDIYASGG